jgi:D-alanine-D-alanine ligase
MNKIISKEIVDANGFKTPKTFLPDSIMNGDVEFPVIAKPVNGGSSIRTVILKTKDDFERYIKENDISDIMFETFIKGKEITVGLLELTKPIALTPIEIRTKREFYDYEAKYVKGLTDYIMPPEIPESKSEEIRNISIELFNLLKCQGFARADFIYDGKDFYFLEMNTIPGFTPTSDVPMAAKFDGISFDEIVEIILKSAFKRKIT